MRVTVNLSPEEITQIKRATELQDENAAVAKAVSEFLRVTQLRELKAASGKVDYLDASEQLEALEVREDRPKSV